MIRTFLYTSLIFIIFSSANSDEMEDLNTYAQNIQNISFLYQDIMYLYDIYAEIDTKVEEYRINMISKSSFINQTEQLLNQINIKNIENEKLFRTFPSRINLKTSSMQNFENTYSETYDFIKYDVLPTIKKDLLFYEQMVAAAKIGNFDLADELFFKSMDNGINMLNGENKLLFIQNSTTDPNNPRYDMNNAMIEMNNSFIYFYRALKSVIDGTPIDYNQEIFNSVNKSFNFLLISEKNMNFFDNTKSQLMDYGYYDYVELIDEMLRVFELWIKSEKEFVIELDYIYSKYDFNSLSNLSINEIEDLMLEFEEDSIAFTIYMENRFRYSNQLLEIGQAF